MSTTEHPRNQRRPLVWTARTARLVTLCCLACAALLATAGCSTGTAGTSGGSSEASAPIGAHMAGPAAEVNITAAMLAAKPKPWDLSTPESAVRSYLDWTNYAYRIATSEAASATTGPDEGTRVDSYIQYNLEKKRLTDQQLTSISFGKPSTTATATLVPTKEQWKYSYLSIEQGNKVLGGPYTASYDVVYTVVKNKNGGWQVYSVKATPKGAVK